MREVMGDLWEYWERGDWIVITTNGSIRHDGACVMGRGVALQAAQRFPNLPYRLGDRITSHGNVVHVFTDLRLFAYPVKNAWMQRADLELIREGALRLSNLALAMNLGTIFMVRPGCGNGGLSWDVVKPIIEPFLDERFCVVERGAQ